MFSALAAGLAPAVNMDTGFGNLIDDSIRRRALELTQVQTNDFVAGAFVGDQPGATFKTANIFAKWKSSKATAARR